MFSTATITPGLDRDGMDADERRQFETLRAHRAMGLLMQRVPLGTKIGDWVIRAGCIEALVGGVKTDHEKRAAVMRLAEQFGFEYREDRRDDGLLMVTASGTYADAHAKFWQLVKPCGCGCDGAR